jgi:hypothetical protein
MGIFLYRYKTAMALLTALTLGVLSTAEAATTTYNLVRTSGPVNVNDAEGRWQFTGGEVLLGSTLVGYFTQKKRFSFAATPINKSSMEMTIIWALSSHNFTVQGEHSFSTGAQLGGVSAASPGFAFLKEGTFTANSGSITITY